jgi:hypothetical protein
MSPTPNSPFRNHHTNKSLSGGDSAPATLMTELNLSDQHEGLIGAEFHNPTNIIKQPTLVTLGDTSLHPDGDEVEHHRVVATEIVKDPLYMYSPGTVLLNAIVLLDP